MTLWQREHTGTFCKKIPVEMEPAYASRAPATSAIGAILQKEDPRDFNEGSAYTAVDRLRKPVCDAQALRRQLKKQLVPEVPGDLVRWLL